MKVIAVYFDDPAYDDYPFSKEEYKRSYHEFAGILHRKGTRFVILRGQETYLVGNAFSKYWEFDGTTFQEKNEPITVDVIYDKSELFQADADAYFMNDPALDALCTDKDKTAKMFPDSVPKTIIVQNAADILSALEEIPSSLVVAKPLDGAEGHGIFITLKNEIARNIPNFPYILQEFIDTSAGIPGIVEGKHDFRIVSIQGKPVLCFVRTPPEGSYLANVAQGGSMIEVPIENIPSGAMDLFRNVEIVMSRFPTRLYSTDMGRTADGRWILIELNSKPALFPINRGPTFALFQERLADLLLSCTAH